MWLTNGAAVRVVATLVKDDLGARLGVPEHDGSFLIEKGTRLGETRPA